MPILGSKTFSPYSFGRNGLKTWAVGDVLPNGGTIFYDAGSVLSWGRYIAAAPQSWNGGSDPNINWVNSQSVNVTTSTGIGTGQVNTDNMVASNSNTAFAGGKARSYTAGGSTWSLPSRDELTSIAGTTVTMQSNVYYWSSSQYTTALAYMVYFQAGTLQNTTKDTNERVRPICYFTG